MTDYNDVPCVFCRRGDHLAWYCPDMRRPWKVTVAFEVDVLAPTAGQATDLVLARHYIDRDEITSTSVHEIKRTEE